MSAYRPLRTTELAVIRELYPQGGARAVAAVLDRPKHTIYKVAQRYGIKYEAGPLPYQGYPEGKITTSTKHGRSYKRIKKDGKMQLLHRVVWEEANGPIPKGSKIYFKDGDSTNCELSNLKMI
jgi:hypothetical protein